MRPLTLIFALCIVLAAHNQGDVAQSRPNIVLIIADDQGWNDYSFMGHARVQTPRIDRLAKESLVFKRGYVPSSLCRASLATMITGLYPHQHGITSNDPPLPQGLNLGQAMREPSFLEQRREMAAHMERAHTLPRLLASAGYVSYQSGKWWEDDSCRCGGFTEGMTHGDPMRGGRHGDEGLKIGRQGLQDVEQFVDRAVLQKKPFYLWYAPMMPHQPHNPPERLLSKYRTKTDSLHVARYWAMCEWFDETVGELLDHLERKGLTRNTLVIYLADNGWIQDSVADRFAPRSKTSPYDGGIRTPILLRRPGTVRSRTAGALAISIDLAPTILQAVGLKPLPLMPGVNLLDDRALRRRKMIFGEIFTHNATDIHKPAANLQYRWVIENNWKLILPAPSIAKNAQAELYDLARDPQEMQDQAVTNQDKIARLARLIENWWPITADATQY